MRTQKKHDASADRHSGAARAQMQIQNIELKLVEVATVQLQSAEGGDADAMRKAEPRGARSPVLLHVSLNRESEETGDAIEDDNK